MVYRPPCYLLAAAGFLLVLVTVATPRQSVAQIALPDATLSVDLSVADNRGVSFNNAPLPQFGFTADEAYPAGQNGFGNYPAGYGTAAVFGQPAPTLIVSTQGAAESIATLNYYFYLNGPTGVVVPIVISGAVATNGCGGACTQGLAVAPATVFQNNGSTYSPDLPCLEVSISCSSGFSLDYSAVSDETYEIELGGVAASLEAGQYFGINYDEYLGLPAAVSIDPIISIDPTFADADQFQLMFSPNVGNSPTSVPEPPTFALFAAGLIGLGWTRRRGLKRCPASR
jgi:hypothetical protein